ncbi:MAG: hypothetical protein WCR16_00600 [Bacilli bacterium]
MSDFIEFNPSISVAKNTTLRKFSMDQLIPNTRLVSSDRFEHFSSGSKFQNGDTLFAKITPCLENGKTSYIQTLREGEIAFGSTEFIVCRAKPGVSLPLFVYYLMISKRIRDRAIASMTGSSGRERVQQVELDNIQIPNYSLDFQRHIVGTIGSVDDLIEKNAQVSNKTMEHANLLFTAQSQKVGTQKLHGLISFVKGKKPELYSMQDGLLYLTIDSLTGNTDTIYSSSGIRCSSDDVLMVMDGASSGKVFIGFNGYVGSTLAKIVTDIPSSLVYLFLHNYQQNMMENTTGSAIPHADKGYIGELEIPMIKDQKVISELSNDLKVIQNLRKSNLKLAKIKKTLLEKYF